MWRHAETCSSGQLSPSQSRKLSLLQEYFPGFMSDLVFHLCDCVLHIVDLRCPAYPLSFIWLFSLHTYGTSEDSHTALQSVVNQQSRPSVSLFMCDSSELPSYGDAIERERQNLEQGQLFVKWIKMNPGQRSLSKRSSSKMTKRWKSLLPKCPNSNPRIGEPPALHYQCLLWCLATFIIVTIGVLLHAWCNLWLIRLEDKIR